LIENDLSTSVPTLIAHIKSIEGYTTTYRKAWLEKQNVVEDVYDNWERSYHDLLRLLQVMQKFLPGMVVEKETLLMPPQGGQPVESFIMFHRLFWSFRPCIDGFQYCKPIIHVNGTWLYSKYRVTLFVAVAKDGNNKILLIAFAIVESESVRAWQFFLRNLKRHGTPQHGLCLILDRHQLIKSVYSRHDSGWTTQNSVHVFCRHIA